VSNVAEGALLQLINDEWVAAELFTNAAEMGEVCMRSKKSDQAESNSAANSPQNEKSRENFGLSTLTSCLLDAHGNSSSGGGRARRKALGVSALIQFCTLTALLIVPLFATGSRLILRLTNFVPLPPYGGAPKQTPASSPRASVPSQHDSRPRFAYTQVQAPTHIPTTIAQNVEESPMPATNSSTIVLGHGVGTGSDGDPNLLPAFGEGPQPPRPEPTQPPLPRKPVVVSQGVQLALLTHRVEPVYPSFARQAHREGTVELRAIISSEGAVRDLQILSGDPVLAQSARDAVAQWRFRPTLLNGVAVEVITFVTVNFHIDQ
jgi:periplasmic protein TonB